MSRRPFQPGDPVVYAKEKYGLRPGPRAIHVSPAQRGDDYHYSVEKQWVVIATRADGKILVRTRRGKVHAVDADDRALRHASLWDRLRYLRRFPRLEDVPSQDAAR